MTPPTAEELAAVLAAIATRRSAPEGVSPYERWRRQRIEALRRRP